LDLAAAVLINIFFCFNIARDLITGAFTMGGKKKDEEKWASRMEQPPNFCMTEFDFFVFFY